MNEHNTTPSNLIQEQGKVTPNFDFSALANDTSETEQQDGLITGEQLLLMPYEKMPTLIEPILQRTGIACLAGSSDTGKSTLLRQSVIAIVTGETDFLGFPINAVHRSAIYVSTEDLESETIFLLKRQASKYTPDQLKGLRYIFGNEYELKDKLDEALTIKPADIVVIDCFGDGFGKDLKSTHEIRAYLNPFQDLAQKHKCLILFLHHTGKRTQNFEPNKDNLLSGQGLEAKMRVVFELRADLMNPAFRHLCIVKGNYLPANYKRESFVLQFDEPNFHFTNTGERVPFELLVKNVNTEQDKEKYLQAKELTEKGFKQDEIAKIMGYASKGTISKLLTKGTEKGWDK
jgi:RecA-family ATPase